MNFALQALLLLLFYLPGALFWTSFTGHLSSDDDLPIVSPSISVGAAYALLISLALQGAGLLLFSTVKTAVTDLLLLSGAPQDSATKARDFLINHSTCLWVYVCLLPVAALVMGWFLNWLMIVKCQFDRSFALLRFYPQWHYLLAGYDSPFRAGAVAIDILTAVEANPVVYAGFVADYWFDDETGALDVIFLAGATRQSINFNRLTPHPPGTPIVPSATFAVKFNEAKNVNIRYIEQFVDPATTAASVAERSSGHQPSRRGMLAGLLIIILVGVGILFFKVGHIADDLAAQQQVQTATTSEISTIQRRIGDVNSQLANLAASSLALTDIFVGRLHKLATANRAVRVDFQLHNSGLTEATNINLRMAVNGHASDWTWDNPTVNTMQSLHVFTLRPGETKRFNAWTHTGLTSRVEVYINYSDGSRKACAPIGFCQSYDLDSDIAKPCNDWNLREQSACRKPDASGFDTFGFSSKLTHKLAHFHMNTEINPMIVGS